MRRLLPLFLVARLCALVHQASAQSNPDIIQKMSESLARLTAEKNTLQKETERQKLEIAALREENSKLQAQAGAAGDASCPAAPTAKVVAGAAYSQDERWKELATTPWKGLSIGDKVTVQQPLQVRSVLDGAPQLLPVETRGKLLEVDQPTGRWKIDFGGEIGTCWVEKSELHLHKLGKVWRRWEGSSVKNITDARLCAMLGDAHADDATRRKPGFVGWQSGPTDTIPVPYAVRMTEHRGLGVFAGAFIAKGSVVHTDHPYFYVRVSEGLIDLARKVVTECSDEVVVRMTSWCVLDWTTDGDGIMCELDDGRYVNDCDEGETANVATCEHDPYSTCATRDILDGEEIVEDYTADEIDDDISRRMQRDLTEAASDMDQGASGKCSMADEDDAVVKKVVEMSLRRVGSADSGLC